jgi:hypothetical protein
MNHKQLLIFFLKKEHHSLTHFKRRKKIQKLSKDIRVLYNNQYHDIIALIQKLYGNRNIWLTISVVVSYYKNVLKD